MSPLPREARPTISSECAPVAERKAKAEEPPIRTAETNGQRKPRKKREATKEAVEQKAAELFETHRILVGKAGQWSPERIEEERTRRERTNSSVWPTERSVKAGHFAHTDDLELVRADAQHKAALENLRRFSTRDPSFLPVATNH
ncbi:hypothetical protein M3Y99_01791000 [Aphelenchoides fujianensis]|nr:hypothetical protein M3Y99_01791000 [Aphelenchoides fujianensis]